MTHERALVLERERILADLHDGLGASLIGLLHHVRSGQADATSIERRVHEALREMRIGARLDIQSRPSHGTTVRLSLPRRLAGVADEIGSRSDESLTPQGLVRAPATAS